MAVDLLHPAVRYDIDHCFIRAGSNRKAANQQVACNISATATLLDNDAQPSKRKNGDEVRFAIP